MSLICGIGVIPFIIQFICIYNINNLSFHLIIPLCVGINGLLYHIFLKRDYIAFLIDTISNLIFTIYINLTTENQPETIVTTILIILIYCLNKKFKSNNFILFQEIIHVLVVQWGLLFLYIKSKDYDNKITNNYKDVLKNINIYELLIKLKLWYIIMIINIIIVIGIIVIINENYIQENIENNDKIL